MGTSSRRRGALVATVFTTLVVVPIQADAHSDGRSCQDAEGLGPVLPLLMNDTPLVGEHVHCHDSGHIEEDRYWYTGAVYAHVPGVGYAGICTNTDHPFLPPNQRMNVVAGTGEPTRENLEDDGGLGCEVKSHIQIQDDEYDASAIAIAPGTEMRWKNDGPSDHTSTYDGALAVWDSGSLAPGDWPHHEGDTFTTTLTRAGTYEYRCTIVPDMTGRVWVVVGVSPPDGTTETTFTLALASDAPGSDLVSDVQVSKDGGEWTDHTTGTADLTVAFEPGDGPGTYELRSRARDAATGHATEWSPPASIRVTS